MSLRARLDYQDNTFGKMVRDHGVQRSPANVGGPRKAGVVAAICWPGGLAVAALGVYLHQLWLLWGAAGA